MFLFIVNKILTSVIRSLKTTSNVYNENLTQLHSIEKTAEGFAFLFHCFFFVCEDWFIAKKSLDYLNLITFTNQACFVSSTGACFQNKRLLLFQGQKIT